MRARMVAVCGASQPTDAQLRDAESVGRLLAEAGCVVVCGGLGGVMAAAAAGARAAGGVCIGLLPGDDPDSAASDVTYALATGMGEMRNALIARCCSAMIAIGGGYGTLSELALALRLQRPVAALGSWHVHADDGAEPPPELHRAGSPDDAVQWVLQRL